MGSSMGVRSCLWVLLAAAAAAFSATTAPAQRTGERILAFESHIQVHANGWVTVKEAIKVRSEAKEIRHGIYRDFPVRYAGRDSSHTIVPFQVVSVRRDGKAEGFHTQRRGDFERIYMGKKDVLLPAGVYTYEFTYRAGRLLSYTEDHDELYFNVTGNEWNFPIDAAEAKVTLPKGVPAGKIRHEAYTGKKGAKGKSYRSAVDSSGLAGFTATRPLKQGEGLTIVVTWAKGHVVEPSVGLEFTEVDDRLKIALRKFGVEGVPPAAGVLVTRILQGSPAHAAGVKKWDAISAFAGTAIKDAETLHETISKVKLDKAATLVILRMDEPSATGDIKWRRHSLKIVPVAMREVIQAAGQCPLKLVGLRLGRSDKNVLTLALVVKNVSPQNVVGYKCSVYCFDLSDKPVKHSVTGAVGFRMICRQMIKPGQTEGGDWTWTLESRKTTAKVNVVLESVRLGDGSEWTPQDKQTVSIQGQWKD